MNRYYDGGILTAEHLDAIIARGDGMSQMLAIELGYGLYRTGSEPDHILPLLHVERIERYDNGKIIHAALAPMRVLTPTGRFLRTESATRHQLPLTYERLASLRGKRTHRSLYVYAIPGATDDIERPEAPIALSFRRLNADAVAIALMRFDRDLAPSVDPAFIPRCVHLGSSIALVECVQTLGASLRSVQAQAARRIGDCRRMAQATPQMLVRLRGFDAVIALASALRPMLADPRQPTARFLTQARAMIEQTSDMLDALGFRPSTLKDRTARLRRLAHRKDLRAAFAQLTLIADDLLAWLRTASWTNDDIVQTRLIYRRANLTPVPTTRWSRVQIEMGTRLGNIVGPGDSIDVSVNLTGPVNTPTEAMVHPTKDTAMPAKHYRNLTVRHGPRGSTASFQYEPAEDDLVADHIAFYLENTVAQQVQVDTLELVRTANPAETQP
jgi:hypothetical protein